MRKNTKLFMKKMIAITLGASMIMGVTGCGRKGDNLTTMTEQFQQEEITTQEEITAQEVMENTTEVMLEDVCEGTADAACENSSVQLAAGCEPEYEGENFNTNEYDNTSENSWMTVTTSPLSTFAADVDTASYSQIRNNIVSGYEVDASMVRIEEMLNYFHYDYQTPGKKEKFGVYTEYTDCPWNEDTKLALVSLNTEPIDFSEAPASNIVFLIDTSGSMFDANKLPLVQQSLCMLAENLTEKDRVSIVTYAGNDSVELEGASGADYYTISSAVERLEAYGSTNGAAGIETAYRLAEENFIQGGNNRVILCTDGDLNVGVTSEGELEKLISKKKESGVFLSVIGVGYGNYKDNKLETLADKGNGNYAYIDSIFEAKKALVDNLGATMVTVAKDVKLQVEFNPAQVKGYRLIGYENRVMAAEDFNDDTKDGGEMGAGHSVTALYEIALSDSEMDIPTSDLKYGNKEEDQKYTDKTYENELFTVNVRYKEPEGDKSSLSSYVCDRECYKDKASDNMNFAAAVACFGLWLKDSRYRGTATPELAIALANSTEDVKKNRDEYKVEFVDLIQTYMDNNIRVCN